MREIIPLLLVAVIILLPPASVAGETDEIHLRAYIVGENLEDMEIIREKIESLGLEMGDPLNYVPFQLAVFTSRDQMREVLSWDGVERIQEEWTVETSQDTSVRNVKAAYSRQYSPETAHEIGFRGEGMTIAIIDSGVDNTEHPTFRDSFVAGADFSSPESPLNPRDGSVDPDDLDGHGTGVASVALGRGDHGDQLINMGVAPEAGLIDLRIRMLGPTLENPIAAALEWCIDNRDKDWGNGYTGIDVISISAGLGRPEGPVHSIITTCVENGLPVVSAATNSGEAFEDNADGPNYWSDDSIIVGGTDDMGTIDRSDDEYWPQSTWGPRTDDGDDDPYDELKPDISAPASNILVAEGSDKSSPGPVVGSTVSSGTSYATPHVSGTVALMIQANPEIRPGPGSNPIRRILHETAEARGEPYDPSLSEKYNVHYGYGILDAYEAVRGARDYSLENSPPEIREFDVIPSTTTAGSTCSLTVDVNDPDRDRMTFDFNVDGGQVTGEFPDFGYTAPFEAGSYRIEMIVTDVHGASDSASTMVTVIEGAANQPPRIIDIKADPEEIVVGGRTTINVDAQDPDGDSINFEWSTTSGTLDIDGDTATLTSVSVPGTVTVEVIARDPSGAEDSDLIRIKVREQQEGNPPFISSVDIDPDSIVKGDTSVDVILKAKVTSTDSSIRRVVADLSSMDMGEIEIDDTGSYPDEERGDEIYTLKLPPVIDLETGSYEITVTAVDSDGRTTTVPITFTVTSGSNTRTVSDGEGGSAGSILIISVMGIVAVIIVFVVVRISRRDPR